MKVWWKYLPALAGEIRQHGMGISRDKRISGSGWFPLCEWQEMAIINYIWIMCSVREEICAWGASGCSADGNKDEDISYHYILSVLCAQNFTSIVIGIVILNVITFKDSWLSKDLVIRDWICWQRYCVIKRGSVTIPYLVVHSKLLYMKTYVPVLGTST